MSLILEALKKLDREKKTPDRGFLVVGAVPWPAPRPRRWMPALFVAAAGVAAGAALWLAWRARGSEEAPRRVAAPATMAAAVRAAPSPGAAVVATPAAAPAAPPLPVASQARAPEPPPSAERPAAAANDRPAPAAAEPSSGLQLQAISQRDGRPIAVLNSRVVHEGDHFEGVTILRIGVDEVEIEVRGRRRTLRF